MELGKSLKLLVMNLFNYNLEKYNKYELFKICDLKKNARKCENRNFIFCIIVNDKLLIEILKKIFKIKGL